MAEKHERLVVGDVVGVDRFAAGPIGVAPHDVFGREQMVEAGVLDRLGELGEETGVAAQVGVAERDS
jgi:hypothetical protein